MSWCLVLHLQGVIPLIYQLLAYKKCVALWPSGPGFKSSNLLSCMISVPCYLSRSSIVTPHPSQANFIAPGKRPLSAMSPIIVSHKPSGRLVALAGASGGPLIVSATLQTLARWVVAHKRQSSCSRYYLHSMWYSLREFSDVCRTYCCSCLPCF